MVIYLIIVTLLITITWGIIVHKKLKHFLHIFQLEGYKLKQFLKWLNPIFVFSKKKTNKIYVIAAGTIGIAFFIFSPVLSNYFHFTYLPIFLILGILELISKKHEEKPKKPLVMTGRAKRILIVSELLSILFTVGFVMMLISYQLSKLVLLDIFTFKYLLIYTLSIIWVEHFVMSLIFLSGIILFPVEKAIQRYYVHAAKKKIRSHSTTVIGITGSYGKTSTKHFLNTILQGKYKVLMTPGSYNTTMGVCKVINNSLNNEHELFVVEMGARNIGDIKEITDIVKPEIGIITAIGEQHLETFKSINNVINTKYELISSLPENGLAVFNKENSYCRKMFDKTSHVAKMSYGLKSESGKLTVFADQITYSIDGTSFRAVNSDGDEEYMECKLLGKHNVINLLGAITIAQHLTMTLKEIKQRISMINPVPHRLEILRTSSQKIVIDDTFNSNPEGAKSALEVLSMFRSDHKVLVTPGMVELGSKEYEYNEMFGKLAGKVCDEIILVGKKRSTPIFNGIKTTNFPLNMCHIVKNLDEATTKLRSIVKQRSVILFENDLPDNYNE
jgi:UDP-N-acetylmuramoyl-tripeptide--D-alanyl-D-alanine ligase